MLALYVVYGPAVNLPYAQNDDYNYFRYENRSSYAYHPQYEIFRWIGRHGYNFVGYFMGLAIRDMEDIVFLRIAILITHALSMTAMMMFMVRLDINRIAAFLIISPLYFLPGIPTTVLWVTLAPFTIASLLGILGGIRIDFLPKTMFPIRRKTTVRKLLPGFGILCISYLCLLGGLFTYPAWALFYVLPILAIIHFKGGREWTEVLWKGI